MAKATRLDQPSLIRNAPTMLPYRRSAVALAVAAALAASAPGYAQADKKQGEEALEEVVVTGFRASLMDAMDTKKKATSIVEAVSAEEIGKLPDVSIAESIARLPGLATQRLNGRGQVISVRGLGPDFTSALLNGREQVSTGDNRGVEFDQFPSELLSGVVVYKTPDAGLIGQGLAGTIDMRTVRPLEYGKSSIAANLRYEKADLGSLNAGSADSGWRYSASWIDQFADGKIGVALGFAHMSNPSQEQRFNAWGYPGGPGGALVIGGSKPYVRSGELKRDGLVGVIEFAPTENFTAAVDLYYSKFKEDQQLRGIELPLWWSSASLAPGYTTSGGLVTSGTFNGVRGVMRNDVNARDAKVQAGGINLKIGLTEDWTADVDYSVSKVDRSDLILETYSGIPQSVATADNLGFRMTDRGAVFSPSFNYGDASRVFLTSPQGWGGDVVPGGQLGYSNQPSIDDELEQFRLSVKRDLEMGPLASVEVGGSYSKRDKGLVADEFFLGLSSGATSAPIPNVTGLTDLSFLGIPGMVSYDPRQLIGSNTYRLIRNPNGDVAVKSWSVGEKVSIGYLKLGIGTEIGSIGVTGNVGFQYIQSDQSSTALSVGGGGSGAPSRTTKGGTKYNDFLPSLNLTFDIGGDNYVRFAAAKVMARPRMDDMRASRTFSYNPALAGSTNINNSPWSAYGGNPAVEPWRATAYDLSYEKYFADRKGYVSLAAFYKKLDSYIYNQQVVQSFVGLPYSGPAPALFTGYSNAPSNGKGGSINGFELAVSVTGDMLTDMLSGFGAVLTASLTDSNIKPNPGDPSQPLPGLSKDVYNATLYYDKHGFSARVSARSRSKFLGEVSGFGNGRNLTMVQGETVVDGQIGYRFDEGALKGLSLTLQGFNLTDEPFETYYNNDPRQIRDYQVYGRYYMIGASYRID